MKFNRNKVKNSLLFLTFIFGYIPHMFYGMDNRYSLGLFIERNTRIDFFMMYYVNAVNFLILAWCVWENSGIDKRIAKFIFIITILDIIHLIAFSGRHFEIPKIGLAFIVLMYWERNYFLPLISKFKQNLSNLWQKFKPF